MNKELLGHWIVFSKGVIPCVGTGEEQRDATKEEIINAEKILDKYFAQPQVSDSEVEELFKWFDGIVMSNKGSAIKSSKLNQLKNKFAQQEQRIKELEKSDASKEESSINYYNEMRKLQSKLNYLKGWFIVNKLEDEYKSILKESE